MHRFFIIATLLTLSCLGGFLYYVFYHVDESQWRVLSAENAEIEMSTAILFGVVAFLGLIQFLKTKGKMDFVFMALMALAGAREMDWHKEWTTDSILKSRFYLDPNVPEIEKLIGGVVILFLIYVAFQLIKRVPLFIGNLWAFSSHAWAIGMGLGLLVVAKTLDPWRVSCRLWPISMHKMAIIYP